MTQYLFVYGSLMSDTGSPMARFLKRDNRFLAEISLPGKLYDLGSYPGFVYDREADSRVAGHLFELKDASRVLRILDEFEGINEKQPEASEYRRICVPYQLDGPMIQLYFYNYNQPVRGLKEIPGGNYKTYWPSQPAHRRFIQGQ